jgi:hypothetical protein
MSADDQNDERKSMNRKFTTLGVAFATVMAMAIFAGPASATLALFHSETAHTEIKGQQEGTDAFITNAGTVKCSSIIYTGTASVATPTEITVTPKYEKCTAFGFVSTPIDTNNCHFTFISHPTTPPVMHIVCPTAPITMTAFNCWTTVGSQTVNSGIGYTNNGAGTTRDVTAELNISGLSYTQHPKSFPQCDSGTFTNGTYTGLVRVKGTNTAGTQVGIWWQ